MDYTIKNKNIGKSIKINYTYSSNTELAKYLDDLSYMIYGVSYNDIKFLNGIRPIFLVIIF